MTALQLKWLMIGIILFFYLLELWLKLLNLKHQSETIPEEFRDVYDAEKYRQSQLYKKANTRFSFITSSFGTLLIVLMLWFDGFALVNRWAFSVSTNPVWAGLIYFAILFFAYDIITLPFQIYDTFVIEEKFGFNKTTVKTFITDKLKSWLLTIIIGGVLLGLIMLIFYKTENYFWLLAWGVIIAFQLFFTMFYSDLIVPLFNKQTPLPGGELRDKIEAYATSVGYELKDIYQIDSSRRSTKLNAYFSGLGKKKRIVLYDTLIEKLTPDEIVAVLAHEVGHYKHKHILKGFIVSVIVTGIYLYLFQLFSSSVLISQAMGVDQPNFHIAITAFGILFSPIEFVLGIITNVFSRKNEYQADAFAKETYQGNKLISALKKLSVENLSNLTPHPLYVFFYYSHPPLLDRIKRLRGNE